MHNCSSSELQIKTLKLGSFLNRISFQRVDVIRVKNNLSPTVEKLTRVYFTILFLFFNVEKWPRANYLTGNNLCRIFFHFFKFFFFVYRAVCRDFCRRRHHRWRFCCCKPFVFSSSQLLLSSLQQNLAKRKRYFRIILVFFKNVLPINWSWNLCRRVLMYGEFKFVQIMTPEGMMRLQRG